MPRFTSQQVNDNVIITDAEDGSTYTFSANHGDVFFQDLLFDLNIDELALHEHQLTEIEHCVEVG